MGWTWGLDQQFCITMRQLVKRLLALAMVDDTRDQLDSWPWKAWHCLAFRPIDIIIWALAHVLTNLSRLNSEIRGDVVSIMVQSIAMLQMLIYTWISQYRSTGVKCAFLYIVLIVFHCFATRGALRHDNKCVLCVSVCVCVCVCVCRCLGTTSFPVCVVESAVSLFHRDTLDGRSKRQKPTMRRLGWSDQQKHGSTVLLWVS